MSVAWPKPYRHWLERIGCEALARLVPRLPRRACVLLANALGVLAFRFDARGRNVSLANLEAAFAESFSPTQREKIARESYQNFARTMLDLFWSPQLKEPRVREKYLALEGREILDRLRAEGRGAVLMCVHNVNFEWASLACGFAGFETMIVAESFKNPRLDAVFNRRREISGHTIIAQDRSMVRMFKQVKSGRPAGMLIDLNFPPEQSTVVIETFGMETCVTMLHAMLAQRGNAALIPVEGRVAPDGSCRVILHPPVELPPGASLAQIAQACWDFFEPIIRARPGEWMWAYKHWRYRPSDSARPYPFYANISSSFEKLRKEQKRP